MATVNDYSIDIRLDEQVDINEIFGAHDKHLKLLEDYLNVNITSRGEFIRINGEEEYVTYAKEILKHIQKLTQRGHKISSTDIVTAIQMAKKMN